MVADAPASIWMEGVKQMAHLPDSCRKQMLYSWFARWVAGRNEGIIAGLPRSQCTKLNLSSKQTLSCYEYY